MTPVSLHEAGHAAAMHLSGAGCRSVTLHADGSGVAKGLSILASGDTHAKCDVAGIVSELLLAGAGARSFGDAASASAGDLERATAFCNAQGGRPYAASVLRWACRFVRKHEARIKHLAWVLSIEKHLTGEQVAALMDGPKHAPRPRDFAPRAKPGRATFTAPAADLTTSRPKVLRVRFPVRPSKAELDKRDAKMLRMMKAGTWTDPRARG